MTHRSLTARIAVLISLSLLLVACSSGAESASSGKRATSTSSTSTSTTLPGTRVAAQWPFAVSSPWNMPIGSGATYTAASDSRTANLIDSSIGIGVNAAQYSHPVYVASASDPLMNVHFKTAPTGLNGSGPAVYNGVVSFRIPVGATPAAGSDAHMHVVDPDGRTLHETWMFSGCTGTECNAAGYARTDLYGSGVGSVNGVNAGMRAYGGSAIGGLIRTWEIKAGAIRHAVAVALTTTQLKKGWVWPATQEDSASSTYAGQVPMGSLMAIPPSVNLSSLGLSSGGLLLARALQDYGGYVVDRSAGFTFYAEPSAESLLGPMRADVAKIRAQLRLVTDNTSSSVGGGGTPRVPLAPPLNP